ncbi:MAG: PAS domain S-box protein [Bacteroidales bacterium]|nr:PAS domain S-box protein [Bacteroidales bacterium]
MKNSAENILHAIGKAIIITDQHDKITWLNPAAESLTGYQQQQLIGKPLGTIIRFTDHHPGKKTFILSEQVFKKRKVALHPDTFHFVKSNGKSFSVSAIATPLNSNRDESGGLVLAINDIFEITETPFDGDKCFKALLANRSAGIGIWDWDIENNTIVWDDKMYALYGLQPGEFGEAYEAWLNGVHPDDRESSNEISVRAVKGEADYHTEFRVLWPDGSTHWLKADGQVFRNDAGKPVRMVGVNYDITERKLAEEGLRQSQATIEAFYDSAPFLMGIAELDGDKTVAVSGNRSTAEFVNFNRESLPGKTGLELGNPKEFERMWVEQFKRCMSEREPSYFEYEYPHRNGSIWLGSTASYIGTGKSGNPQFSFVAENITDRKKAEQTLRDRELLLNEMGKIAKVGGWELDVPSQQQVWTDETYAIHDRDPKSYTPKSEVEISRFEPGSQKKLEKAFKKALNHGKPYDLELEMTTVIGKRKWVRAVCFPISEDGKVIKLKGTLQDISVRKYAEEELERFFNMVPDMACIASTEGYFKKLNNEWERVLGYSKEELMDKPLAEFIHPDDRIPTFKEIERQIGGKNTMQFINRYKTKDGDYRWLEWNAIPSPDGISLYAAARDISDRKLAEDKIIKSEARFASVFQNSPVAIGITRLNDAKIVDVNPAFCTLYGFTKKEVIGRSTDELDIWGKPDDRHQFIEQLQTNGHVIGAEYTAKLKNGQERQVLVWGEAIEINNEKCLLAQIVDITERKKAEEKLRQTEQRYRSMIEHAPDGIVMIDGNGKFTYASPSVSKIFGYTPEEAHLQDPNDLTHPEDLPMVLSEIEKLIKDPSYVPTIQYRFKHKNGPYRWLESTFSNLLMVPNIHAIVINFRDITDRKNADEALHDSEEKYRTVTESFESAIFTVDKDGIFHFANQSAADAFHISPPKMVGKHMKELFPADIAGKQMAEIHKVLSSGKGIVIESQTFIRGELRWFRNSLQPLPDKAGKPRLVLINAADIHERKQAEKKLEESEKQLLRHKEHLEELVQERTSELERKNDELERFNQLFIGREFRIKELKDQIKLLEARLSND